MRLQERQHRRRHQANPTCHEVHDMVSNLESNTCGMLNDVERRMYARESNIMSELESRTQAHQESLRVQATRQREEIQSMERRLKDEFSRVSIRLQRQRALH